MMKRLNVFALVLVAMFSLSASAQMFVGGGLGISGSGGESKVGSNSTDKPKSSDIDFKVEGGMFISDEISVGAGINVGTGKSTQNMDDGNGNTVEVESKNSGFTFSPFARYYLVKQDNFSVFGQATLSIGTGKSERSSGGTTVDGPKVSTLGFGVMPGVEYKINDQLSVYSHINVLGLGFNRSKEVTEVDGGDDIEDISTNYNIGAGSDVGYINLTLYYHF